MATTETVDVMSIQMGAGHDRAATIAAISGVIGQMDAANQGAERLGQWAATWERDPEGLARMWKRAAIQAGAAPSLDETVTDADIEDARTVVAVCALLGKIPGAVLAAMPEVGALFARVRRLA
jgi:hypothetical protein